MNDIVDMSLFVEAKSDQLNSDDLIGGPRTITVRKVTGNDSEQPVSIYFDGDNNKPFKPCKTIRRVLLAIWGRNAADYVGRSMTIYRDDSVTFGGLATGGIRISHMSGIEKETVVVVMKTKGKKAPFKVFPLVVDREKPAQAEEDHTSKADRYVAQIIIGITSAADRAALDGYIAQRLIKIKSLQKDFPELYQRIDDTLRLRREEFGNVATDDDLAF